MYKTVYLTEKDSQVQALAPVLGCKHTRAWTPAYNEDKTIALVPLQGHVMRLYNPEEYDEAYKSWEDQTTLCFPDKFLKKPVERTINMYKTAVQHLKDAEEIVIATDFDNEGATLAMEVIQAAGCEDKVSYMLHMGSMNEEALREALETKSPIPFREMALAGEARAIMDWAEGMSYSRALTINLAKKRTVLNFGGVKTPIINMVVERDIQFESFGSIKYWELSGRAKAHGKEFDIKITRIVDGKKDSKLDKEIIADELKSKILENPKYITSLIESKVQKENPKKLYTQTMLQADSSRKFNLQPINTLEIAQKAYIEHKISTYPRTEIDAIHEKEYKDVPVILGNLKKIMHTEIIEGILSQPIMKRPTVFDSKKVTSHGAIIPTLSKFDKFNSLTDLEKKVFTLIAERYIENFLPAYEYQAISGEAELFDDYILTFSENIPLRPGFKILGNKDILETIKNYVRILPEIKKGDEIEILSLSKTEGETKPKPRFTNDTLLMAMENIANLYPEDKIVKEMLGDGGIGTGATRAVILNQLFEPDKNGGEPWLILKGKQIISTEKARKFIKIMPKDLVSPIKRAQLQKQLQLIERGELSFDDFLSQTKAEVISNIEIIKEFAKDPANIFLGAKKEVQSLGKCPICKEGDIYENGKVYMCSRAAWKNEGTKEEPKWSNDGCDYKIFIAGLSKFGKDKIGKLEIKKLLTDGKFKARLTSKAGNSFDANIIVDEKYGVNVSFEEKEKEMLGKCPVCKEGEIYDNGKIFTCSASSSRNEGTKEAPNWVNEGCQYKIFKTGLSKFGKDDIKKAEIKTLLEDGSAKVSLVSKAGKPYDANIVVDEKYGVKVEFEKKGE